MKPKIIKREKLPDGTDQVLVSGLRCLTCESTLEDRWFDIFETKAGLCAACTAAAEKEDYGMVATDHRDPKPLRFVAGESEAGNSSGRERRYMSMGEAENANGCWDNMVRELEK